MIDKCITISLQHDTMVEVVFGIVVNDSLRLCLTVYFAPRLLRPIDFAFANAFDSHTYGKAEKKQS